VRGWACWGRCGQVVCEEACGPGPPFVGRVEVGMMFTSARAWMLEVHGRRGKERENGRKGVGLRPGLALPPPPPPPTLANASLTAATAHPPAPPRAQGGAADLARRRRRRVQGAVRGQGAGRAPAGPARAGGLGFEFFFVVLVFLWFWFFKGFWGLKLKPCRTCACRWAGPGEAHAEGAHGEQPACSTSCTRRRAGRG
jgi:hypothetical protein